MKFAAEIITILTNYFESNGHSVISARNGRDAINYQQKEQPDILILDVMLPDITGTEVCRTFRGTSNVPILMLSAKGTDLDQILALGVGVDKYATKPFSPSVILAKTSALVRRCSENKTTPNTPNLAEISLSYRHILRKYTFPFSCRSR